MTIILKITIFSIYYSQLRHIKTCEHCFIRKSLPVTTTACRERGTDFLCAVWKDREKPYCHICVMTWSLESECWPLTTAFKPFRTQSKRKENGKEDAKLQLCPPPTRGRFGCLDTGKRKTSRRLGAHSRVVMLAPRNMAQVIVGQREAADD